MRKWRIPIVLLVLLALLVAVPATFLYLVDRNLRAGVGPEHTFSLAEQPPYLTEELALAKAREALDLDGLDGVNWLPADRGWTTAPDGRVDRFMTRNQDNPDRAVFMFQRGERNTRFVSVELREGQVVCQTYQGK
jgi:hypothetical protein